MACADAHVNGALSIYNPAPSAPAEGAATVEWVSEWWGVVELAALGAAVGGTVAGGLLGGGDRPLQAGGNLGGVDLGDVALVALGGLPGAGLEPANDHGAVALPQRLCDVLGLVAPDVDAEEMGLPIAPGLAVADAGVDRQAEVCHGGAVVGEPQ